MFTNNESFWYITSNDTSIADLSTGNVTNIRYGNSIFPAWKSFLIDDLETLGMIFSAYISFSNGGMKITYPSVYSDFYANFTHNDTQNCPPDINKTGK